MRSQRDGFYSGREQSGAAGKADRLIGGKLPRITPQHRSVWEAQSAAPDAGEAAHETPGNWDTRLAHGST